MTSSKQNGNLELPLINLHSPMASEQLAIAMPFQIQPIQHTLYLVFFWNKIQTLAKDQAYSQLEDTTYPF